MMPKSLLTLVALSLAATAFGQTWSDPYASMNLPVAQMPQPAMSTLPQPTMQLRPVTPRVTAPAPVASQTFNTNAELSLPIAHNTQPKQLKLTTEHEDQSMLPLRLAGYELRVMDVTKKVSFDLNGESVRADVPIFIYMPREPRSMEESTAELRRLYNDLIMLYDKERVDKQDVRDMLGRLDSVIDRFDALNASITKRTLSVN